MRNVDAKTLEAWERDYQRKKVEDPAGIRRDVNHARRYCRCGGCWCCFVSQRQREEQSKPLDVLDENFNYL